MRSALTLALPRTQAQILWARVLVYGVKRLPPSLLASLITGSKNVTQEWSLWVEQVQCNVADLKKQLGLQSTHLDQDEEKLLKCLTHPDHINAELQDVYGLAELVSELEDAVLCMNPKLRSTFAQTSLWRPNKGVLLHGPPGTGKTMLAMALAKRARCNFLNIAPSTVNSKYFGDANRMVHATFTLARKLQPCVLFVDEVDSFLARRGALLESEGSLQVTNEFLALWDGADSGIGGVLVMGATNRIDRLDEAALRRFTMCREIPLPDREQRKAILAGYLRKHDRQVPRGVAPALLREALRAGCRPQSDAGGDDRDGDGDGISDGGSGCRGSSDVATDGSAPASKSSSRSTAHTTPSSANSSTCGYGDSSGGGSDSSSSAGVAADGPDGVPASSADGATAGVASPAMREDAAGSHDLNTVGLHSDSAPTTAATAAASTAAAATGLQRRYLDEIADQTEGFSGSDMYDLCCKTAQNVLQEPEVRARLRRMAVAGQKAAAGLDGDESPSNASGPNGEGQLLGLLRPVSGEDLLSALASMKQEMQRSLRFRGPLGHVPRGDGA